MITVIYHHAYCPRCQKRLRTNGERLWCSNAWNLQGMNLGCLYGIDSVVLAEESDQKHESDSVAV